MTINFAELPSEKYWSFPKNYSKDKNLETKTLIFSNNYLGSRKMDGAYYRMIKENGEIILQGRNKSVKGEFLNKIDHVPHLEEFFKTLPDGTCLLGEIYFPNNEGSNQVTKIMGCKTDKALQRQEKGEKLHYYIFDIWEYDGESYLEKTASERFAKIKELSTQYINDYIEYAEYKSGEDLWNLLQNTLSIGGEGIVMTKSTTHPEPGKRPARKTLKVKKELAETLDVVIIGANPPTRDYTGKEIKDWMFWQNLRSGEFIKGKYYKNYSTGAAIRPITKNYFYKWAGSLKIGVYKNNQLAHIGNLSGLSEDILENWRDYVGEVAEITAMEIMETGGIRHPRFVGWREDKKAEECLYSDIFE